MTIILSSNNGPHSAEQWANATAQQIIEGDDSLRGPVAQALQPIYQAMMDYERAALAKDTGNILSEVWSAIKEDAVQAVYRVVMASQWSAHFAQSVVQAAIADIIGIHLRTITYIERSWHADSHPDHPAVRQFKGIK